MSKKLQLTALDLKDGAQVREIVANTLVGSFEGSILDAESEDIGRESDRLQSELQTFLESIGIRDAKDEAAIIMGAVLDGIFD